MPIYEYDCEKCGCVEAIQRISDEPLKSCPVCQSPVARRISRSAFHLKGSGWYKTDYSGKTVERNGSNGNPSTSASAKEGKDGAKADDAAGKKEAAKSESPGSGGSASAPA